MTSQPTSVLITGGNKGLGLETSRRLEKQGRTNFLGSRDPGCGHAAADQLTARGINVTMIPLDVTSVRGRCRGQVSPNPFHDPRHIRELRQQCSDKFPDVCVDRVVIEGLPARRLLEASGTRSWSCSVVVDAAESRAPRSVRSVKRCRKPAASRSSSLHAGNDRLAAPKSDPPWARFPVCCSPWAAWGS
ncbi:SDR family NAD(P)-dependent oxidoreductase [Nocardia abscessus]|uniref:SDR family NAD(P)-dependent oxidoreductase n=1 Tax=Nocardia abscessus TaxID=120957 RepID=UPI003CC7F135